MASASPRLWPLYLLGGGIVVALLLIWLPEALHRQRQIMSTMAIFMLAIFLAVLWLLLASRLAWGRRLRYCGGIVLVIALRISSRFSTATISSIKTVSNTSALASAK